MKKYIKLQKKDKDFVLSAFNISGVMLSYALNFDKKRGNSELAKKIRTLALQRGGVLMNELPECETIHDANGMMLQAFANGAMMKIDKNSGAFETKDRKGNVVRKGHLVKFDELYVEQEFAAGL